MLHFYTIFICWLRVITSKEKVKKEKKEYRKKIDINDKITELKKINAKLLYNRDCE